MKEKEHSIGQRQVSQLGKPQLSPLLENSQRSRLQRERSAEKAEAVKQEEMSAYNAFKACAPISWSPNLYITLVRGIPGTRRLHRRTLEALRLRKCNRTVMRWNTPTVRGMLHQVKRLVVIETEEMHKARKEKLADHKALRPPLVVNHHAAPAADSVQ
ncbi:uncharacterized protein LOC107776146 [Nicotiana tabacum]|uniref:Large ribosomal subunit protein uL30m n=2 Tax=Nicotiana tabacum TaxID=4097 RepID=A0A1S3YGY2_TOBAC|nr:PREDICTED: uncharacterized protein LOC107776146 isoform X1 [Nicotiana tabacum]